MDQISQKARKAAKEKREERRRQELVKIDQNVREDDPDWCDGMEEETPKEEIQEEEVKVDTPMTARKQAVMVTLESKEYKQVLKESMHIEELPRKVLAKAPKPEPEQPETPRPTTPIPKGNIALKLQKEKVDIENKDKIFKVENIQREINKEDMRRLRKEASALAEEEKHMFRDGNARDKLTYSLLVQACKMVDLWDQANHYMDVIEMKTGELGVTQGVLGEKITEREGLEKDNEVLRSEIATLEAKLAAQQAKNQEKAKLATTIVQNIAMKKMKAKAMVDRIKRVKANQEKLTGTMSDANSALAKAFENLEAQFC